MRKFIKTFLLTMFIGAFALPFTQAQTQVVIGTDTSTTYESPINTNSNYSWSRILYLSSEIGNTTQSVLITKIAFQYGYSSWYNMSNQTCYLEATTDTSLSAGYINPTTSGATQVWTGTFSLVNGWVEITLSTPFTLPANANLMLHWHHNMGSYPGYDYQFKYTIKNNTVVYAQDNGIFPDGLSGTISNNRPNIRITWKPSVRTASVTEIISPTSKIISWGTNIQASAKIANVGTDTITSCRVNWKINDSLQTPFTYNHLLIADSTPVTINLGTFTPDSNIENNLTVWIDNANPFDSIQSDDTLSFDFHICTYSLNGTYTVGVGGDFVDIEEIVAVLANCGINGPVEFQFLDGTYGTMSLNKIIGSSATNTVTITSYSSDATKVTIGDVAIPGSTALTLDSVSNLVFKNITIGTTTDVTSNGVEFRGYCANILFHSCVIQTYDLATTHTYAAVRYNNSSQSVNYLSNVQFIKNTIIGGYYNMYFYYPGGSSSNLSTKQASIVIDSNNLKDAYFCGIYNHCYAYYPSISYNTITSRAISGSYHGIRTYYCTTIDSLQGNKISITSIHNIWGIYLSYYQNYSSSYGATGPMYIANNEVRIKSTGASSIYGFYTAGTSDYSSFDILHNSFYLEGTEVPMAIGIYIAPYSTSHSTNVLNNLVYINILDKGYMIYYNNINYAGTSYGNVNYNNYYKPTGIIYYGSSSYTSLSAWQSSEYGQDANSVNVNPPFIDPSKDLQLLTYTGLSCPRIIGVKKDIRNKIRSTTTYMGCYEPYTIDLALKSLLSPLNNANFCQNSTIPIEVSITNIGNLDLNMGASPLSVHVRITGVINYQKDTIISTGTLSTSQTINIMMNNALPLLDTGICYVSAYFSEIDSNSINDTVYSQFYVHANYSHTDTLSICSNELPYTYGDSTLTTTGNYDVYFQTINGCDSVINLTLYVNPTYNNDDTITICSDELPYTYGDSILTEEGDYTIAFTTVNGCDSVINLHLRVVEIPTTPSAIHGNTMITKSGNYTYYVDPVTDADSYIWTISNNNWTGSSTTESIELTISDAGTGTLAVKAVNICGESGTATLDIYSNVGIEESGSTACYLGQNIPNPANTSTLIPFSIPEAGNVSFEVVSITGQVLCKKDIQALTGSNSIELDTEILPAGIYYYRIEFNGQRLVKKMTIQK